MKFCANFYSFYCELFQVSFTKRFDFNFCRKKKQQITSEKIHENPLWKSYVHKATWRISNIKCVINLKNNKNQFQVPLNFSLIDCDRHIGNNEAWLIILRLVIFFSCKLFDNIRCEELNYHKEMTAISPPFQFWSTLMTLSFSIIALFLSFHIIALLFAGVYAFLKFNDTWWFLCFLCLTRIACSVSK